MDFSKIIPSVTGFFSGGWISYVVAAALVATPVGIVTYKVTKAFDAQALATMTHKYDTANGQNAVLAGAIRTQNAQALANKKASDARVAAALKAAKEAEARAKALNDKAGKVMSVKPGPDLDISIAQVALEGFK